MATKEQEERWKAYGKRMSQQAAPPLTKEQKRGRRIMFVAGLALLVAGLAATVVTFVIAKNSPTGGTYIVAFGPIIGGAGIMLRAISGDG